MAFINNALMPQNKNVDSDKLFKLGKFTKLEPNSFYTLKKLDFSCPYILPKGKLFIEDWITLFLWGLAEKFF